MIVNNPSGKNQTCEIHPSETIPYPKVDVKDEIKQKE